MLQGQGALQNPPTHSTCSGHNGRSGGSAVFANPPQGGENRRKQSHGKAGLILIKVTKVHVTFGCQEESSGISLFNVSVMRDVALEIGIAVFLQTVPSSNLLEIGFCGAEQFACSR